MMNERGDEVAMGTVTRNKNKGKKKRKKNHVEKKNRR